MSQIRVHELADQLDVEPQQIVSCLLEHGMRVRGPSTVLAESTAARVRRSLRGRSLSDDYTESGIAPPRPSELSRRPETGRADGSRPDRPVFDLTGEPMSRTEFASVSRSAHSPLFAFGAPPTSSDGAPMFMTPAPPAPPSTAERPFIPAPRRAADPKALSEFGANAAAAPEPEPDHDADWRQRGLDTDEQRSWLRAGLRATESALAEQCRVADIEPSGLGGRLSGRTALQRLRDGESVMSVWARLQEARQQQPRSGTRLSGPFRQRS